MTSAEDCKTWHGFKGKTTWPLPKLVARSDKANRADQNNMIKANEYLDDPSVLEEKINTVVDLIKKSKFLVAYTGAGLSKASGIPDYASKSEESIVKTKKLKSALDAQPTYGHLVLTALERAGHLKHWVQQNHDGLPQKAGFPQEKMNEIHGAWFDPSNPVVQFSGSLRGDLFNWMAEWEKKADLCLCLGTSLSGMNADRMANTPAKKSLKGQALGTVLINLQQTPLDERCVVRIWAKLDDAFKMISEKLQLDVKPKPVVLPDGDVYYIPYDETGKKDEMCKMTLNLATDAKVKIISPGASNFGAEGVINGKRDGNWSVGLKEKEGITHRLFGAWWIESALQGTVPQLPLVNLSPKVQKLSEPFKYTFQSSISNSNSNSNSKSEELPKKEKGTTKTLTASVEAMEIDTTKVEKIEYPKSIKILQSHYNIEAEESDNNHKWGLELEPGAEKFVSEVVYVLHPTFRVREMKCKDAPFKISMLGWGTFVVGVRVTLKNGKQYETSHKLTFKESGPNVRVTELPL